MVARARSVETVVTANRREALVLEATLVRRHKPAFNVNLRDGQRYPYVCFTEGPYPRVVVTRVPAAYAGPCHGPYTEVRALREALRILRAVVPLRTCTDSQLTSRRTPCLLFQMKRCLAPCCVPGLSPQYDQLVRRASDVLEGRVRAVVADLRHLMEEHARELRYEEAAVARDRIASLLRLTQRQQVVLRAPRSLDAVAIAHAGPVAVAAVRRVREGVLVGQLVLPLKGVDAETAAPELLDAFLSHYYATAPVPPVILVAEPPRDASTLEGFLSEARSGRMRLCVPRRGVGAELVRGAQRNAAKALEEELTTSQDWERRVPPALVRLTEVLALAAPPRRVVGMDASHLGGGERVASLVVFVEGRARASAYRRYRIRGDARDDANMLGEVAERWSLRVATGELERPDLLLVDGGPVQVEAVARVLATHDLTADIPIVGLAKREETLHRQTPLPPLRLTRSDAGLQLLQRIRDEAHRFAVGYHRARRRRRVLHTAVEDLPGIGPRRAAALLARFGGIEGLRAASRDDILKTPGFGSRLADDILRALRRR
jgi:excinuclease ABC subunit C